MQVSNMKLFIFTILTVLISIAFAAHSSNVDDKAEARSKRSVPICYSKMDCGNRAGCFNGVCVCNQYCYGDPYVGCYYVCKKPGPLNDHSYLKNPQGHYKVGDIATIECKAGYFTTDDKNVKCCLHDSVSTVWRVTYPVCNPIHCAEPSPLAPHSFIIASTVRPTYYYTDKIAIKCEEGYVVVGVSTLSCEASSKWNYDVPSCRRIQCLEPKPLDTNSYITSASKKSKYFYQDKIIITCKLGWVLVGYSEYTCEANKHWSEGFAPSCKRVTCRQPVVPPHAFIHGGLKVYYVYEESVRVQCDCNCLKTTYTCGPYGEWIGKLPSCIPQKPKDCSYQLCGKLAHCTGSGVNCRCNSGCVGNPIKGCYAPQ